MISTRNRISELAVWKKIAPIAYIGGMIAIWISILIGSSLILSATYSETGAYFISAGVYLGSVFYIWREGKELTPVTRIVVILFVLAILYWIGPANLVRAIAASLIKIDPLP